MLYPTTITSKWQMTLPKAARKLLDIKSTGRVMLDVDPKKKIMMVKKSPSFLDLAGTFTPKDREKIVNAVKIRDYMEKHYERT
ncbi:MAG: AbrB/MazE/SpoVT family DNA-binding domain-containing protein [Candidatus Gottesmanbacteria bacterium]|nr:AbrB/MazE/SpoVT family DNA-binding domain-containing protein [Candidatus Gottesmanbacteria bacterium]